MTRIRINNGADGKLYGVNAKKVWRICEGVFGVSPDLVVVGEAIDEAVIKAVRDKVEQLQNSLSAILVGERIPLNIWNSTTGEIIIPANRKITPTLIKKLSYIGETWETDPSPIRNCIQRIFSQFDIK